jgi:hypothetical protein
MRKTGFFVVQTIVNVMKTKPLRFQKPQRFIPHAQKKRPGCPEDNIFITAGHRPAERRRNNLPAARKTGQDIVINDK